MGTIRRSSPDCQVRGSRRDRVIPWRRLAPVPMRVLSPVGSWTTTRVILSRADLMPAGKGVFVGAGVKVASGGGVLVGCSTLAGAVVAAMGAIVGSAPPPQATSITVSKANTPATQRIQW